MNKFIRHLELDVRTAKKLTLMGIETPEQFMALDEETVLAQKGLGRASLNEIRMAQQVLAHGPLARRQRYKRFRNLCRLINDAMIEDPDFWVVQRDKKGLLVPARLDKVVSRGRFNA